MSKKTLVTYASRLGSTAGVAQAIAQALRDRGDTVDVMPLSEHIDLNQYSAVVVGSAIRFGHWLPEAVTFVSANQTRLRQLPTACFTVCLTLYEDTAESRQKVAEMSKFLDPIRAMLQPTNEAWFAGKMDLQKLNWIQRIMARMLKFPEGDFRNWETIHNWANQLFVDTTPRESRAAS